MKKNIPILIAGSIMALTSLLHLFGGQLDHVVPLLDSQLSSMDKAVWLGVWHMVTAVLILTTIWLIKHGLKPKQEYNMAMRLIAWLNILFAVVFIAVSLVKWEFTPQWILFLPMGLLVLFGLRSQMKTA